MSLYLYQLSPTRPGTAPGAETRARWGRISLPLQPALPGRSLTRLSRRPVTCAPPAAATAGCICRRPAGPPARARPRRFKYADRSRRGGGGRGRKGEEGGRKRSREWRGEPQPGAQGTRCEVVRFPPPTPLPAAAPSPATPPPSAACRSGACCFLLQGRNCATLGARGALIYIFLSPARSSQNNLALSTLDPGSASASLGKKKKHTKTLPGAHPGQGLGAHSDLSPSLLLYSVSLSPSSSPFSLLTSFSPVLSFPTPFTCSLLLSSFLLSSFPLLSVP